MGVEEVKFFKKGDIVPDFLKRPLYKKDETIFKIDVIVKIEVSKNYSFSSKIYRLYPDKKSIKYYSEFFNNAPSWKTIAYKEPPGLKWRILNGC